MAGVFGTNTELQDAKISVESLKIKRYSVTASALTLTSDYEGRTIVLNRAAGIAVTLPAATGTGMRFRFLVGTSASGGSYTIVCAGTDEYGGTIIQTDTDTSDALASYPALAGDNYDTITLNGGTTGGLIGDWIEIEDVASGTWALAGMVRGSGTVATPLS